MQNTFLLSFVIWIDFNFAFQIQSKQSQREKKGQTQKQNQKMSEQKSPSYLWALQFGSQKCWIRKEMYDASFKYTTLCTSWTDKFYFNKCCHNGFWCVEVMLIKWLISWRNLFCGSKWNKNLCLTVC